MEDDAVVRGVLTGMVERLGCEVQTAASGEEVIAEWADRLDQVRGVILDWTLPGMRGDQVARRLRAVEPGLPLILTSGDEGLWDAIVAKLGRPLALLPKPFSLDELRRALRVCRAG